MTAGGEPVVVCVGVARPAPERLLRLADVVVTRSAVRCRPDWFAAWFRAYPGLGLVVVERPDRTAQAGTRDGAVTSWRIEPSVPVRLLAVAVYHDWVAQLAGPR